MTTLVHDLFRWKKEAPDDPALAVKVDKKWQRQSASDYASRVLYVASFLKGHGMKPGDRALILSRNCPEWLQSQLGSVAARMMVGGLYTNASTDDYRHVVSLIEPKVLFVEDAQAFARLSCLDLSSVELVIVFRGTPPHDERAVSFEDILRQGRREAYTEKQLLSEMKPSDPAFLILTSGTTGNPKAAMLSNDNLFYAVSACRSRWEPPARQQLYSFLPASHVAEHLYSLCHGIHFRWEVNFSSDMTNVLSELAEVQPIAFLATPRIWQKIMERTQGRLKRVEGFKAKLLKRAQELSLYCINRRLQKKWIMPWTWLSWRLLDSLVLKKIRFSLGLSNAIKPVSGSAALPNKVRDFFRSIGVSINESYAQTESSGILSAHPGDIECAGTVGYPYPWTEFKLADDGEILTRGRHVFKGYFRNEKSTRETIKEGWLHTGDLGRINEQGQIVFIGRKKEVIKPLEGKMIAPLKIEQKLVASPLVSQAVLFGESEKFLTALITVSEEVKQELGNNMILRELKVHMDHVNKELARFERVRKFSVLEREFSLESGELTPTMKPKRHVIAHNFKEVLDGLYGRSSHDQHRSPNLTQSP